MISTVLTTSWSPRERALDDQERAALRTALHEMAAYIGAKNNTEKTGAVDPAKGPRPPKEREKRKKPARGHGRKAAVYVSGTRHAGENAADWLRKRVDGLEPPVLMCDALNRNQPKDQGVQVLLANCLAHGRRKFVDVFDSFPEACRHVLKELGKVYLVDAEAREKGLDKEQRLKLHQAESEPVMKGLQRWLTTQIDEKLVEPNSRLGKAIRYLLTH